MKRRLLIGLAVLAAALVLSWSAASVDRCGNWPRKPAMLTHLARGQGHLQAGAAKVELQPRYPTTAAGYGWYIDPTPLDDSEFTLSPAHPVTLSPSHRMDLLSAVMHELGHTLGHSDLDPSSHHDDLMSATLGTGVRRTDFAHAADAHFGSDEWTK